MHCREVDAVGRIPTLPAGEAVGEVLASGVVEVSAHNQHLVAVADCEGSRTVVVRPRAVYAQLNTPRADRVTKPRRGMGRSARPRRGAYPAWPFRRGTAVHHERDHDPEHEKYRHDPHD